MSDMPQTIDPDSGGVSRAASDSRRRVYFAIAAGVAVFLVAAFLLLRTPSLSAPDVVGMTQGDAEKALSEAGLTAGRISEVATLSSAPSTVVEQKPASGVRVKKGSRVDLAVAMLPKVEVPDVVGQELSDANEAIVVTGLRPGAVSYDFSDAVNAGTVMSQHPVASSDATVGAFVDLKVSKGQRQSQVPNVVGLSEADATSVVSAAGFESRTTKAQSKSVSPGDVLAQSPEAGVQADQHSTVTMTVSTGAPQPAQPSTVPTDKPSSDTSGQAGDTNPPPSGQEPEKPEVPSTATEVPNVVGMNIIEGIRAVKDARLSVRFDFGPTTDLVLKIAAQDPEAGVEVDGGTVVTLTIGLPEFLFSANTPTTLPAEPLPGASVPSSGSSDSTGP